MAHDDEFREEQKCEMVKLLCWLAVGVIAAAMWALMWKGFICMCEH